MTTSLLLSATLLMLVTGGVVAFLGYRATGSSMNISEFFRRLMRASGVKGLSAADLSTRLSGASQTPLVVDLSLNPASPTERIPGVIQRDFDDFLREALVEQRYDVVRHRPLVLVCDHGNLSRIAGDVLVEEAGFTRVFSLRGGMSSWARLRRRLEKDYCCSLSDNLATCCR